MRQRAVRGPRPQCVRKCRSWVAELLGSFWLEVAALECSWGRISVWRMIFISTSESVFECAVLVNLVGMFGHLEVSI